MNKGILVWNIILTVILIAGFSIVFLQQAHFINQTNEEILVINENIQEMYQVISEHAETINQHTETINQQADLMTGKYLTGLEANQEAMNEMVELIDEYREILNKNAVYFEKILENLEDLSIVLTQ